MSEAKLLEKEAYELLLKQHFQESFNLFTRAAEIYKRQGNHQNAAICYASAASCWSKKSGEKTFYNAALSYEAAAKEAQEFRDLEYASMLYKYAAINYERDREFINFSDCFYNSKECYRQFLTYRLLNPKKIHTITKSREGKGVKGAIKRLFLWLGLSLSYIVWGHGERPVRTFYSGLLIIFISAIIYSWAWLLQGTTILKPDLAQSFYFSVITFTTVGYGDLTPLGLNKIVVIFEALCGLFIIPLFMIGLSRKYLRV